MIADLSKKTVCVVDIGGVYTHIAEAVRDDFAKVLYWTPWDMSFAAKAKNILPGIGIEGIEHIADFYDHLDNIDLFVFPDVGYGGLQEDLRRRGWAVFGSGAGGRLERDRLFLKQACEKAGIESAEYAVVKGVPNLRRILAKDFEAYVKMSYFRADGETFRHDTKLATQSRLDEMSLNMGPYQNLAEFIVELPIADDDGPCVEVGFDTFFAGAFPRSCMWGYEAKDAAFVATTVPLPSRLRETRRKLIPILAGLDYRGAFSTETRENSGTYFLDATCRFASPPSEIQTKLITNLAEIMWGVANGEAVEPEFKAKFGAQLVMNSDWYADHPLALQFDYPDRTIIHGHCIVDKQHYAASPTEIPQFGAAIGIGDTIYSAIEEAIVVADSIKGRDVNYDSGALNKAWEIARDGQKLGLDFDKGEVEEDGEESRSS